MNKKYTYLIIIFLTVASLAAFGRIVGNDFINFDDNIYITDNHHIKSGIHPESVWWAFSTFTSKNWHPITWLSLLLDHSIFGMHPGGYHLVNLLLHIGSVIVLFLFLSKTTTSPWPAAFASALFALHPLRVESVAWAAERKDVLSMFFGMASLYAYAFYTESRKTSHYMICLMLFTLSLLSKSMLVTLPFILLLLDYWPLGRWKTAFEDKQGIRRLLREKVPFLFLTIVSGIMTIWAQYEIGEIRPDILFRSSNAIISYLSYLHEIFYPSGLSVFYPFNFFFPPWQILGACLILSSITIVAIYHIKKAPFLFVGWCWYLGTLIPVIGLVPVNAPMADRYTYLPSIGISIMIVWAVPWLIQREDIRKKIVIPLAIISLFISSLLTYQQCGYWKNSITLYDHSLQGTKDNLLLQTNLAIAISAKGKKVEAITLYDRLIRLAPNMSELYYNRGNVFADLGKYQKAIEDYNRAIHIEPQYADAYNNRGTIFEAMGQYQKAIEDCSKAISITPGYVAYFNRGNNYNRIGRDELALKDFSQAINMKPDFADAYNNRGVTYIARGKNKEGCRDAHTACKLGNCNLLRAVEDQRVCSETR